jgi:hypothetical protein
MISLIIIIAISVALVVHISILLFKQKKQTDMIIELYEEFLVETEKNKRMKREQKCKKAK